MKHVFCTAANSTTFNKYAPHRANNINVVEKSVTIFGGAGVADKKNKLFTPLGVHTAVSDEDWEWLKDDYSFKQHMKAGYITVRDRNVNAEVAAADMVTRDRKTDACPMVPQEYSEKPAGEDFTALTPKLNKRAA